MIGFHDDEGEDDYLELDFHDDRLSKDLMQPQRLACFLMHTTPLRPKISVIMGLLENAKL